MSKYTAVLRGRKTGSIGKVYTIRTEVSGESEEEARVNLYEKYEHISYLTLSKMKHPVHFKGINSWNHPMFKDHFGNYYGSLDKLFSMDATESEVLETVTEADLVYFGKKFESEPMGTTVIDIYIMRSKE